MKDYQLIRGARVAQYIDEYSATINETTFQQLELNVKKFKPVSTKRQWAVDPVRITQLKLQAFPIKGILMARAEASSKKLYTPVIAFYDVSYIKAKAPDNITFVAMNNKMYNIMPIDLRHTHVKVKCNCPDFRWRFAMYNYTDDSLLNKPPRPYRKKTNRKPNNPQKLPGMCKHLIKTAIVVVDSGIAFK